MAPVKTPIAVCCGDLHLTLQAPACRADEDWLAVQAGYLEQLRDVAGKLPVLCAGDIFDRWNPPPELIHFALEHLPTGIISVPGQHDLPNHRIEDMRRSGYGVLAKAGKIQDISNQGEKILCLLYADAAVKGFGWGEDPKPIARTPNSSRIRIALIHRYIWIKDKGFPGASEESRARALTDQLKGYDIAISGDNHQTFTVKLGDCTLFNCGTFMRRKQDERTVEPRVGVIWSDGSIVPYKLDTRGDKFHKPAASPDEAPADIQAFLKELEQLGEHGIDFRSVVEQHLRKGDLSPEAQQIIREAIT